MNDWGLYGYIAIAGTVVMYVLTHSSIAKEDVKGESALDLYSMWNIGS